MRALVILLVLVLSSCSVLNNAKRLERCDSLLQRSEERLIEAVWLVDSLARSNDSLKTELDSCHVLQ